MEQKPCVIIVLVGIEDAKYWIKTFRTRQLSDETVEQIMMLLHLDDLNKKLTEKITRTDERKYWV